MPELARPSVWFLAGDVIMPFDTIKREGRVAFSRTAQPVWFRITKWVVFIGLARRFYGTKWFWTGIVGGAAAGTALHFVYRWKTQGWTHPWGGWNDLAAGQREKTPWE